MEKMLKIVMKMGRIFIFIYINSNKLSGFERSLIKKKSEQLKIVVFVKAKYAAIKKGI